MRVLTAGTARAYIHDLLPPRPLSGRPVTPDTPFILLILQTILAQPLDIVLIAIPLLIQTYGIFAIAYLAARWWRVEHAIAGPCALIGTSNFFELAVAVAISLFGLQSGAALATVVGVLVEVPVMLSLVAIVNRTRW